MTAAGLKAATIAADSTRGAQLFETLACVQCHGINGKGGTIGPDLGRRLDRNFTPAGLAATMWNHAPTMWAAMRERSIVPGDLNDQAAADLFAYFYSARFFEKPGDAARGKRLFESKHCVDCHGSAQATHSTLAAAPPVSRWESIGQPIALADAMWNHGATMREEFSKRHLKWAELTSQNLTDLLVYLRNLPQTRNAVSRVEITAGAEGEVLFKSKGCERCHTGNLALTGRLKGKTLTDIAAAMWNHEPRMAASPPQLSVAEMREVTSYLWAAQFFEDAGDPGAGRRVFTAKHGAACHEDSASGAPKLAGRAFSGVAMVSALWHHGPQMLDRMKAKNISWPRFEGTADVQPDCVPQLRRRERSHVRRTEASRPCPAHQQLDQDGRGHTGYAGWLLVVIRSPGEHPWARGESLHRAAGIHRDSRRVLRRPRAHPDWNRAFQTPRRRRLLQRVTDRPAAWRRAGVFFAVMTMANIVIGSQVSYRAVEHMETVQFCGQSCHVMKPEFTAHLLAPHQAVACASCHIVPGATGWLQAKMSGTRQLMAVTFNSFPRPIESAMESNRLVPSADTCEQCHAREKFIGPRLRVLSNFKDDEANTRTETVLTMLVGGGRFGGIHGAHIGPGVRIRYAASDRKRQTIPWVEYRNAGTGATRTYLAGDAKPGSVELFANV